MDTSSPSRKLKTLIIVGAVGTAVLYLLASAMGIKQLPGIAIGYFIGGFISLLAFIKLGMLKVSTTALLPSLSMAFNFSALCIGTAMVFKIFGCQFMDQGLLVRFLGSLPAAMMAYFTTLSYCRKE